MGWFSGRHEELLTLLAERQRVLEQALEGALVEVHEIKTALVVRDPGNRLSADAYQGLRQAVMAGANARRTHLVQLAQMADAVQRGADSKEFKSLVEEWVIQAGLTQVDDPKNAALYEILDGAGEALRVRQPAWVDTHTGSLIRRGTAERIPAPPKAPIDAPDRGVSNEPAHQAPLPTQADSDYDVPPEKPSEPASPETESATSDAQEPGTEPEAPADTSGEGPGQPPSSDAPETQADDQHSIEGTNGGPKEANATAQPDGNDGS